MAEFQAAKISDLRSRRGVLVRCGGQEVALFLINGQVVAVSNGFVFVDVNDDAD